MPLAEACHVALQRHPAAAGEAQERAPAVRVVSFNAGAADRAPAFEVELAQLVSAPGKPAGTQTHVGPVLAGSDCSSCPLMHTDASS